MKINHRAFVKIVSAMMALLGLAGCQKVINVDLNEAAPRIVIEGLITDRHGPYTVSISKSGSYFNQPVLETVSGAIVIVSDDFDNIDTLIEAAPGIYRTTKLRGIPGRTYTLKVISEEQVYEGSTTMGNHVNIDSLNLVKSLAQHFEFGGDAGNESRVELHCYFTDPPDKNYYRIRVFKNDSINTQNYRLYDDHYTNGLNADLRVSRAEAGNVYKIELWSLDKLTYGYYRTLADLLYTNPFFGSTPANPDSNLSNGALGYFGAVAIGSKTVTVTESMIESVR